MYGKYVLEHERNLKVTLSEIDTLLSFKIFGNSNYLTRNYIVSLTAY